MACCSEASATATAATIVTQDPTDRPSFTTGLDVRLASRAGAHSTPTCGLAPTYIQANVIVLGARHAADFRLLCLRNPTPCPLLAESMTPGAFAALKSCLPGVDGTRLATDLDLRRDCPRYTVYRDGVAVATQLVDVVDEWQADHVAFLVGCSYSFEAALADSGLTPMHVQLGRNVAMYRTAVPLCPAGVFTGSTMVVSMRQYRKKEIEKVRTITRGYVSTHGEPVAWGWGAVRELGISDLGVPEWGDAPLMGNGQKLVEGVGEGEEEIVPLFWGCGVTPQEAVVRAKLEGTVIGHSPGHMLVLDIRDWDIVMRQQVL